MPSAARARETLVQHGVCVCRLAAQAYTERVVPQVLTTDPRDVADALREAARVMRHDAADAVDWIRRAAQLAQDAGHDQRAIDLALAATEILDQIKSSGVIRAARREAITTEIEAVRYPDEKSS